MATFEENLAALNAWQSELKTSVETYFGELAGVINTISYPDVPTGTLADAAKLDTAAFTFPAILWPTSPDINYSAMSNIDKYKKHIWEGPYLDQAESILMGWAVSGGVGISQAVQDAVFNQDRERRRQTLNDSLTILAQHHGGMGFRYANARLDVKQSELVQKYQFDDTELSRTIVKTISELAQKNAQFAMSQVTDIEKLQADFSIRYSALYLDTMTHVIETYKADVAAKASQLDSELRRSALSLEAFKVSTDNTYKSNSLQVDVEKSRLLTELERTKLQLDAITKEVAQKVQALESMASTTAEMLKATMNSNISLYKG